MRLEGRDGVLTCDVFIAWSCTQKCVAFCIHVYTPNVIRLIHCIFNDESTISISMDFWSMLISLDRNDGIASCDEGKKEKKILYTQIKNGSFCHQWYRSYITLKKASLCTK